jgi:hypothetical protein
MESPQGGPTGRQILDLPMQENDADAGTIRAYLIKLLAAVWEDGEGFSGKHPFGNDDWEWDLQEPLVRAGYIAGRFDEGYLVDFDEKTGEKLIASAIQALGEVSAVPEQEAER